MKIAFLFIVLLGVTKIEAQSTKIENSTLWKIEGNGLKEASYLMGTIHLMCESDFTIKDKIINALEKTDKLVLEIDFADQDQMTAMQKSMMGEKKLSEIFSKEKIAQLDKILKEKMNAGIEAFDQYSLMALYSFILTQSITCPSKKLWEFELIALANENNIDIDGLEGIDEQMGFFSKAWAPDDMLDQILHMDEYAASFDDMVALYNSENISDLGEVVNDPRFMDENAEYWMLEVRNKNWLKKMPTLMAQESNFFAVGSAHLVGEFGLIPNLQDLGYKVTPVFK